MVETRKHRIRLAYLMTALLAVYGLGTLVHDSFAYQRMLSELYVSAQTDRAQLVSRGVTPKGKPPEEIVGRRGPAGIPGAPGADGATGAAGRDGRDGRSATPEQIAAAVDAYLKAHPVKAGPAGRDGRDGADGQSPACLAEVDECRGATGATGERGADGPAGQPPAAWLWTDPATKVSYECRRVESPDSAPAYACAALT